MGRINGGILMFYDHERRRISGFIPFIPKDNQLSDVRGRTTRIVWMAWLLVVIWVMSLSIFVVPASASEVQSPVSDITEISPNSVFILRNLSSPITTDQMHNWSNTLIKTKYRDTNNNDLKFVLGEVGTEKGKPVVAYAMSLDDTSVPRQYIGRANSETDVAIIHEQALSWKNNTLESSLDAQYPYEPGITGPLNEGIVTNENSSVLQWEATQTVSHAPYGELVGMYSLRNIIAGNAWDEYGLQTKLMTIPGSQIYQGDNGYINANASIKHLWEGDSPKYNLISSDPGSNSSQTGYHGIVGHYESAVGTSYSFIYHQTNVTVKSPDKYPFTSPTWIMDYSTAPFPDRRGEFNPISIVAAKRPEPGNNGYSRLVSIGISGAFRAMDNRQLLNDTMTLTSVAPT